MRCNSQKVRGFSDRNMDLLNLSSDVESCTNAMKEEGLEVKFVAFLEYSVDDAEKIIPKTLKLWEAVKKNPEKHVKYIFPGHVLYEPTKTGMQQSTAIFEADDEEKLIDYYVNWFPEERVKIVPLLDLAKTSELYLKAKK